MFKITVFVSVILFFLTSFSFAQGEKDNITITTYYPSPYGVYNTLRLYPNSGFTPGTACSNEGEISYYDGSGSEPAGYYFCDGTDWKPLGGGAGGYWAASGDDIYNTNPGNVGIGMMSPGAALHVNPSTNPTICVGPYCAVTNGRIVASGGTAEFTFLDRGATSFVGSPTAGERWVWYSTGGTARLWSGGDKIAITSGGNVGIGTTSPTQKLDVTGNVKGTGLCIGSDCRTSWPTGGNLVCWTVKAGPYANTSCDSTCSSGGGTCVSVEYGGGATTCSSQVWNVSYSRWCRCCNIQ